MRFTPFTDGGKGRGFRFTVLFENQIKCLEKESAKKEKTTFLLRETRVDLSLK